MKIREIEQFEKKCIYSLKLNNDLKEKFINDQLNELNRVLKQNIKRKNLVVFLVAQD